MGANYEAVLVLPFLFAAIPAALAPLVLMGLVVVKDWITRR